MAELRTITETQHAVLVQQTLRLLAISLACCAVRKAKWQGMNIAWAKGIAAGFVGCRLLAAKETGIIRFLKTLRRY